MNYLGSFTIGKQMSEIRNFSFFLIFLRIMEFQSCKLYIFFFV